MIKFRVFGKRLFRNEDGATAIEYGLLAALIAVGIIAIVGALGQNIAGAFNAVDSELVDAAGQRFGGTAPGTGGGGSGDGN